MKKFLERFGDDVNGVVSGWDRLAFRGSIGWLSNAVGVGTYLSTHKILLKDFARWTEGLTLKIRNSCDEVAKSLGITCQYLPSSSTNKEELARSIARQKGIESGPICMFSVVEPSFSPTVTGSKVSRRLELEMKQRRCVWIYFYFNDSKLGFGHIRLQTWMPFAIKGCLNGRHWLARSLDAEGIDYLSSGNCFRAIADAPRAQQLFDEQLKTDWSALFAGLMDQYFPVMSRIFPKPMHYYWSMDATEWATDIMFHKTATLDRLFPVLARHALVTTDSANVMRFLGRIDKFAKLPSGVVGDIRGDRVRRHEGICVKHRDGVNSVKTYNKAGNVLRIETTINRAKVFKVYRPSEEKDKPGKWLEMRKGVADLERRARVSQASNSRYADALAGCSSGSTVLEDVETVCRRAKRNDRNVRALNPCNPQDYHLLKFLAQGQWAINGFRNKDVAAWIDPDFSKLEKKDRQRLSSRVSRLLFLLQAHGLINKVQRTHRYMVTSKGQQLSQLITSTSTVETSKFMALAA